MLKEIQQVVNQGFADNKVVVIGDMMLDKYLIGEVSRVSPEAPVPVLKVQEEKCTLGGAGNVALNLKGLGISVLLMSMVGDDIEGKKIKNILAENNLSSDFILASDRKPTITKTRIVGENQQIVRIDKENPESVEGDIEAGLVENFKTLIQENGIDAVILSDYAKGLITETLCRFIIKTANKKDIPVFVDPKGKDFTKYKNATILMPNQRELSLACNVEFDGLQSLQDAGKQLYNRLNLDYLVVTRGEKGILLIADDYVHDIPTRAREIYDVSGAGDTVIATAVAGLIKHLSIEKSLELANMAAGYVVSKFGTHPISYAELNDVIHHHISNGQKLFDHQSIKNRLKYWRNNNQKIVFTNGCFDILHAGHIHLLQKARQQADKLIVGINTDASVELLKGADRPVNKLEDRMRVLEAISYVDAVIPFSEATPLRLIEQIKPDVLVKGADYEEADIVGAKEVKSHGGTIIRIPLVEGKSTSRLIKQVSATNE